MRVFTSVRLSTVLAACAMAALSGAPLSARADAQTRSAARPDDRAACSQAIAAAGQKRSIPSLVLGTIALVESGRPIGNRVVPWPWSINVDGVGHVFATKDEAIRATQAWHAAGSRSIDVGCMQINLAAHPLAFASLEDAFDPRSNADYAARFLGVLYRQSGQLAKAMTDYHSQTPVHAADYARRLLAVWPGAAAYGLSVAPNPEPPPPPPPTNLTPAFAQQIAANRDRLRRQIAAPPQPASALAVGTIRGTAWPGRS